MPLPSPWATPKDFATLFQYLWYRDFPMGPTKAIGARASDWTMHTAVTVRSIAGFMRLITRFEIGGHKDAVLRSSDGDEIALEWEWEGVWGDNKEVEKLRNHKVWSSKEGIEKEGVERPIKYAALITYTHTPKVEEVCNSVARRWKGARWPLLLILIDVVDVKPRKFVMGREFNNISMFLFDRQGEMRKLREAPAFPWKI